VQRRHVYEAALSRWIRDAVRRGGLMDVVKQQLIGGSGALDLEQSFVAAAQRIGHAMYAAGAVDSLQSDEPWARLYSLTEDALCDKRDALVKFRLRQLQTFLAGCPLRIRPAASFARKSFRDYLAAAHYAANPASPDRALLTLDPVVQRFAAEFIDPGAATDYIQNAALTQPVPTLGSRLVDLLRSSRQPTVVANAARIRMNPAGPGRKSTLHPDAPTLLRLQSALASDAHDNRIGGQKAFTNLLLSGAAVSCANQKRNGAGVIIHTALQI
jgi:hypothetical protein